VRLCHINSLSCGFDASTAIDVRERHKDKSEVAHESVAYFLRWRPSSMEGRLAQDICTQECSVSPNLP
jgi:hypothetical protein